MRNNQYLLESFADGNVMYVQLPSKDLSVYKAKLDKQKDLATKTEDETGAAMKTPTPKP